jgi:hypothetical protein
MGHAIACSGFCVGAFSDCSGARREARCARHWKRGLQERADTAKPEKRCEVSEALKRLGFETIVGLDLDDASMKEKSIAFARAARDAYVALVYYSGHAMQFDGFNYLMQSMVDVFISYSQKDRTIAEGLAANLTATEKKSGTQFPPCPATAVVRPIDAALRARKGSLPSRVACGCSITHLEHQPVGSGGAWSLGAFDKHSVS